MMNMIREQIYSQPFMPFHDIQIIDAVWTNQNVAIVMSN